LEKIPRKRILSLNGTVESAASCNTLPLNESQLTSLKIVLFFFSEVIMIAYYSVMDKIKEVTG
jgi:hypothetical protein